MMNLLLSILQLDPKAAYAASEVSVLVIREVQILPWAQARSVYFVRNCACRDWLEEDPLTIVARMCRTTARKGIRAIGISSIVRNSGCSWVNSFGRAEVMHLRDLVQVPVLVLERLFLAPAPSWYSQPPKPALCTWKFAIRP